MKYMILLYDGMADEPVPELGGKTPMMCAKKPRFDYFASKGEVGMVRTVAKGLKPGSDVANLSVLGYDPEKCYTGRSPLEALSMGIDMKETDVSLRCNLVTLSDEENYEDKRMLDYCAGDISSEEAAEIIKSVNEHFKNDIYEFFAGIQYRHCLIWHGGTTELGEMTPPHDIFGKVIGEYLSTAKNAEKLVDMMKRSYDFLKEHPVNKKRIAEGKKPANSIWLWGEGRKPMLDNFYDLRGKKGAIVSAVDLLKGIGKAAGMETPEVEGATGYIDTNFKGKAECAAKLLETNDFVYLHFEATDECGHRGEAQNKIKAIEMLDDIVLPIVTEALEKYGDYKVMILPDHPTPIVKRTHTADPVPYMIYHKMGEKDSGVDSINEESAAKTGNFVDFGPSLIERFLGE